MSYRLNKTDGSLLVDLVDGRLDTETLNINLIGKNYQGFGESINENFIKMLENFSNSAAPSKPIKGQLWYDTGSGRLKVFDGVTFRSTDSTIFSSSRPDGLIDGDIWIDGTRDQMFFWNGNETVLVGPNYTKNQLKTGDFVETIKDTAGLNKTVIKKYIGGNLIGITARQAFTPFPAIEGFDTLVVGFNVSGLYDPYVFTGVASTARQLEDELGNVFDVNSFVSTGPSGDVMNGRLVIDTDIDALQIGDDRDITIKVSGDTGIIKSSKSNNDLAIELVENNTNPAGNTFTAMYFDTYNASRIEQIRPSSGNGVVAGPAIGIFTDTPAYALDINGSVRITKDLIVEGDSISLDIQSLRIEDKQIELAIFEDSTLPTDADVDDAGIVVRVTGDDKRWTWRQASNSWTSSHSIEMLPFNSVLKIDGNDVISKTTLGSSVISSSLTTVGQLESLTVGSSAQLETMTISEDTIQTTTNLILASVGDVRLSPSQKIFGVSKPLSARAAAAIGESEDDDSFAATKGYVDEEIAALDVITGIDVTGLGSTYATGTYSGGGDQTLIANVCTLLNEIKPAAGLPEASAATIHATNITATTDAIDVNSNINKTIVTVDAGGVQNTNVIQDFSISDPTASVNLTVNRYIITVEVQAGQWEPSTGEIAASAL